MKARGQANWRNYDGCNAPSGRAETEQKSADTLDTRRRSPEMIVQIQRDTANLALSFGRGLPYSACTPSPRRRKAVV